MALAFADNYNVYVRGMMNDLTVRRTFQNVYTLPIRYLHTLPDNAYFLLVADQLNFFMPSDYEWWRGNRVSRVGHQRPDAGSHRRSRDRGRGAICGC